MFGTTVASFLACAVFRLVPCKVTITPYFFFTRIMTTGVLIALSFQAGNTADLYLSGEGVGVRGWGLGTGVSGGNEGCKQAACSFEGAC